MNTPSFRTVLAALLVSLSSLSLVAQDFTEDEVAASVDVRDVDSAPKAKKQGAPVVPSALRAVQASVQVGFLIDERGYVRNPRIIKSSNASFNDIVLDCVRDWQFEPATRGGQPVAVRVIVPMRFK